MNEDQAGPSLSEHLAEADDHLGGDRADGLVGLHHVKVDIRAFPKRIEHLVQHVPVLAGDADELVKAGAPTHLEDHRHHLDAFRPRPEDAHDLQRHSAARERGRGRRLWPGLRSAPGWRCVLIMPAAPSTLGRAAFLL